MLPVRENSIHLLERLLHKTNQPFDRQTVYDEIPVFERLGLSVQNKLYTASRMAVFV